MVLGGTQEQATQITALIMAGATVVAYIIGEGMIDAANAGAPIKYKTIILAATQRLRSPQQGSRQPRCPGTRAIDSTQ